MPLNWQFDLIGLPLNLSNPSILAGRSILILSFEGDPSKCPWSFEVVHGYGHWKLVTGKWSLGTSPSI